MLNALVPSMRKATLSPKKIGKIPVPLFYSMFFLLGSGRHRITQPTHLISLHGRERKKKMRSQKIRSTIHSMVEKLKKETEG